MGVLRNYLKNTIIDKLEIVNSIGDAINNLDNSKLDILETRFKGMNNMEKHKESLGYLKNGIGFFQLSSEKSEVTSLMSNITRLNSQLSSSELYNETAMLGINIIKNNFENKEDIDKFNKMFKECKYCFHWSTKYNECRHYPIPYIVNNICKSKFIIRRYD